MRTLSRGRWAATLLLTVFITSVAAQNLQSRYSRLKSAGRSGWQDRISSNVIINYSGGYISVSNREKVGKVVFHPKHPDFGKPGTHYNITEARTWSLGEAKEKAKLKLAATLESVPVDGQTRIGDFIQTDRALAGRIGDLVYNAAFFNTRIEQFNVQVELFLPITGRNGLLHAVSASYGHRPFPQLPAPAEGVIDEYSALILDVSHLPYEYALHLRMFTPDGMELYGPEYVSQNYAVETGMAGYVLSPDRAKKLNRAGKKPYYTHALDIYAGNPSNLVLSRKDAAILFSQKATRNELRKCRVILVVKGK